MEWALEALSPVQSVVQTRMGGVLEQTPALDEGAPVGGFAKLMESQFGDLSANVGAAETAVSDLATGKPVELHDVMIRLERARMSVQVFVQVRNKLVESYQDLMRMQL